MFLLRCLGHLLWAAVEHGDLPVDQLAILPASTRHQLLHEWNDTVTVFDEDVLIHRLFEHRAAETPDALTESL